MSPIDKSRRYFITKQIPGLGFLFLLGCREVVTAPVSALLSSQPALELKPGTVAWFLQVHGQNPIFAEQTSWPFAGGENSLKLIALGGNSGDYHYLVDDQLVFDAINHTSFDASRQSLQIESQPDGIVIYFYHPPPRRRSKRQFYRE